jgi:prepilin-type N-terminal cleavage/methylation domain-containing protein
LRRTGDEGFTLIEALVAIALITIVGTSFTIFLTGTTRISHHESIRDTAAQVAAGGMERARSMRGAALLAGRAQCDSTHSCADATIAAAYLGTGAQRWDASGAGTPAVPLPTDPETVELDGLRYQRYYYVARCWLKSAADENTSASRPCGNAVPAGSSYPAEYVRLVVAVTWPGQECAAGICSFATAALLSASATDPYLES